MRLLRAMTALALRPMIARMAMRWLLSVRESSLAKAIPTFKDPRRAEPSLARKTTT